MLEQGMGTFIVNAGNLWINDTRVIGWESDKNAKSELTFETRTKFRPFIISWGGSVLNAAKSQFQNLGFSGGKGYGLSYSQGPSRVLQSRPASLDRKSVGWGRSVSVRVDLGGRRSIKKKKKKDK